MEPPRRARRDAWLGAASGASLVLGWVLADLVIYMREGEAAYVFRSLMPGSAAAVALGGLAGALLGGRLPLQLPVALAALALGQLATARSAHPYIHPGFLLGSVGALVLSLALVELAGRVLPRHLRPGRMTLGLALGGAACLLASRVRFGEWVLPRELVLPLCALVGLDLVLAWSSVRSDGARTPAALRPAACALALGAVALLTARSNAEAGDPGPTGLDTPPATLPPGSPRPPNLILMVLDTVRADHLSCYGYERETSPGLDAFARDEATLYTKARATSPFTLASHASLLTGLYPARHGANVGGHASRPLHAGVPTLGERLVAAGYRTGAIFANHLYLNRRLGFERGFHHFQEGWGTRIEPHMALVDMWEVPRLGHTYRNAARVNELALDWIDSGGDAPFFLALNYMDAHGPFVPPKRYYDMFRDPGRKVSDYPFEERRVLLYDSEIRHLDDRLSRFRDKLRERGLYDDTWLVITADHGHAFGDHGHNDHCWLLYEEQVHVPLLVKPAGERERAVDERPITGVEVHDLLLRAAGVAVPERDEHPEGLTSEWYPWPLTERNLDMQRKMGRDLSRSLITWVRDHRKVIVYSDGEVEAYDLDRDPGELDPLELSPAETEAARAEAAGWWEANPLERDPVEQLDEETLRQLSELGYG